MFQQPEEDFSSSARYYASPQEQKILIQGLQNYFSLPERSQNRNKIAKDVSTILRMYSPHWTHRAVRLWFNNNKHTYLPTIPGVGNVSGGAIVDNSNPIKNPMGSNVYMNPNWTKNIMIPNQQIPIQLNPLQPPIPPNNPNLVYIPGGSPMLLQPPYQQMNIPYNQPLSQPPVMQPPIQEPQQIIQPPVKTSPKTKTIKIPKSDPKTVLNPITANEEPLTPYLSGSSQKIPTSPLIDSPDTFPMEKEKKESKCAANPPMKFVNAPIDLSPASHRVDLSAPPKAASDQNSAPPPLSSAVAPTDMYESSCSLLREIRRIDAEFASKGEMDVDHFLELVDAFDVSVMQLSARFGPLNPEIVEPLAKFVRISFPQESPSIYNTFNSSSNLRLDSTSFSNIIGMPSDMSISYLMFPESMSNFDLSNSMFPRMPSTSSFNQLQMINDPSFSSFKDISSINAVKPSQNAAAQTGAAPAESAATTNDGNSIVNSNSASESDSESNKEDQSKRGANSGFHFPQSSLFQQRPFVDDKISYFEAHALNDEYAAYTSSTLGATQRMLYVIKYKEKFRSRMRTVASSAENDNENGSESKPADSSKFSMSQGNSFSNAHAVESRSEINSLAIDHDNAWMLSGQNVIKIPISQSGIPQTTVSIMDNKYVNSMSNLNLSFSESAFKSDSSQSGFVEPGVIATYNSGFESNIKSGSVVCYPSSNNLYFINGSANSYSLSPPEDLVTQVPTKFGGFVDISNMYSSDRLLCAVSKSSVIRLFSPESLSRGIDERCFVGHCGQVLGIHPLSDQLFASRGDDGTVRLWDIRERQSGQISTITTPNISPISITGNGNYLICGFHNKYVCVVDLRMDLGVPVLGVPTQEYAAIAMNYCQEEDSLTMIGVVEKETVKDSMVFAEISGQSRLRILRCYYNFIGTETPGNE